MGWINRRQHPDLFALAQNVGDLSGSVRGMQNSVDEVSRRTSALEQKVDESNESNQKDHELVMQKLATGETTFSQINTSVDALAETGRDIKKILERHDEQLADIVPSVERGRQSVKWLMGIAATVLAGVIIAVVLALVNNNDSKDLAKFSTVQAQLTQLESRVTGLCARNYEGAKTGLKSGSYDAAKYAEQIQTLSFFGCVEPTPPTGQP